MTLQYHHLCHVYSSNHFHSGSTLMPLMSSSRLPRSIPSLIPTFCRGFKHRRLSSFSTSWHPEHSIAGITISHLLLNLHGATIRTVNQFHNYTPTGSPLFTSLSMGNPLRGITPSGVLVHVPDTGSISQHTPWECSCLAQESQPKFCHQQRRPSVLLGVHGSMRCGWTMEDSRKTAVYTPFFNTESWCSPLPGLLDPKSALHQLEISSWELTGWLSREYMMLIVINIYNNNQDSGNGSAGEANNLRVESPT